MEEKIQLVSWICKREDQSLTLHQPHKSPRGMAIPACISIMGAGGGDGVQRQADSKSLLADQPKTMNFQFIKRPCLKGIRQQVNEEDREPQTSCSDLHTCVYSHTHVPIQHKHINTHKRKKTEGSNWKRKASGL